MMLRRPSDRCAHGLAGRGRLLLVALMVTLGLLAGACGGDDDQLKGDRLAEELGKSNLPQDVADCVAEELPDGLSQSAIEQQDDAEAEKFLTALGICSERLAPDVD